MKTIFLFSLLISMTFAISDERIALCQIAEAIPYLQKVGWKSCSSMTDTVDLKLFQGLYFSSNKIVGLLFVGIETSGTIPDVFDKISTIQSLSISLTSLSGTVPTSIIRLPLLNFNCVDNLRLNGDLPILPPSLTAILIRNTPFINTFVDISRNINAYSIEISNTKIQGITQNLSSLLSLQTIDLSNNMIASSLPNPLAPRLTFLNFSRNKFSGTIPSNYLNHTTLNTLFLNSNELQGTVPWARNKLIRINFSNNRLSGLLPSERYGNIVTFNVQNNQFSGTIPYNFFVYSRNGMDTFDISRNQIEGSIPDDLSGIQSVRYLDFSNNLLTGSIQSKLFMITGMTYLHLQNNRLNGTLQGEIMPRTFNAPLALSLAGNSLSGSIPSKFFTSAIFNSIDISGNNFSGCGPTEPLVSFDCNFGDAYYTGCTPKYAKCNHTMKNDCLKESGYFGSTCKACSCISGLLCDDGVNGSGICEGFNPCKRHNCEGICNINGNGFICSCPFPAIINVTDKKSCDCPFGFTKGKEGSCIACKKIDNCLQIENCNRCSICNVGYELTSEGQCFLNKNCLFSEWNDWSSCNDCRGGITLRYRNLSDKNNALPFYCQEFLYNRTFCGFPCIETTIQSKDAILDYLYRSFTQWNWLAIQMNKTAIEIEKTTDEILIHYYIDKLWLQSTIEEILPEVNNTRYIFSSEDNMTKIQVLDEVEVNITGIALGASFGLLLPLTLFCYFLLQRRKKRWLFDLPQELQFYFNPKGKDWIAEGNCKMKEISLSDEVFQRIWSKCSTDAISVKQVYLVSNSILGASFSNYRSILRQRIIENPILFNKRDWRLKSDRIKLREYVHERFLELASYFEWNDPEETIPIIACLHATDFNTARSISSKGFCALATLDEGFYGKGIYFSTYGSYIAPYFIGKESPAILVNLVICGNAFPVIEASTDKENYLGKPTVSGYQSHFVCTKSDGTPIRQTLTHDESNEIVISQEAQAVPIYIVCVGKGHQLEEFSRSSSSTLLTPLLIDDNHII